MLNYTYDTIRLGQGEKRLESVYVGVSKDIAESKAVLACRDGEFLHDYAVLRIETNEVVALCRASMLKGLATRAGLL